MTTRTMSFASILGGRAITAQYIDSVRRWLKMGGIYAITDTAQMIKSFFGDGSYKQSISNTMGAGSLSLIQKVGVALTSASRTCPKPTLAVCIPHIRMQIHLCKETAKEFSVDGNRVRIGLNHSSLRNRFDGLGATTFTESLCPSF